jgi:hypothetical protein
MPTETSNGGQRKLISGKQSRQLFKRAGLSYVTFQRRVQAGQIDRITPETKTDGYLYPEDQVWDAIHAAVLAQKASQKAKASAREYRMPIKVAKIEHAVPSDMEGIAEVLRGTWEHISVEKRRAWIARNPEAVLVLKCEGEIVGCAFLSPLPEENILRILQSPVKPPTRTDDIQIYEPGKHYCVYMRSVVVRHDASREQHVHWAAQLIQGIIRHVIGLTERGIILDRLYAQTNIRHVEHLLRCAGFVQMPVAVTAPDNRNYMLDVMTSGSPLLVQYQRRLSDMEE